MGKRCESPKSRSWFASAVLRPPLGAMQTEQEFSGALFCEGALVDYSPLETALELTNTRLTAPASRPLSQAGHHGIWPLLSSELGDVDSSPIGRSLRCAAATVKLF